jgi:DNA polymerase-3 subunit epsilon
MYPLQRWWWQRQRRSLAATAQSPLRGWLEQDIPGARDDFAQTRWLVIDLETTGLESDARIISVGWVPIRQGRIVLGAARHRLVNQENVTTGVGDSATVHRITDTELDSGAALAEVLTELFENLQGHWPVFHGAALDTRLLDIACREYFDGRFAAPWADTLQVEKARRERRDITIRPGDLQLDTLRHAYRLPPHTQHHALSDALATAELFCAQARQIAGGRAPRAAAFLGS